MRTDDFDYSLPPGRIAQTPLPRGESRLLVLHREDAHIEHRRFADLPEYLRPGDVVVVNDTRVIARRLLGENESGRQFEALIVKPLGEKEVEALIKPSKRIRPGAILRFQSQGNERVESVVTGSTGYGGRILKLASREQRDGLFRTGVAPLPPYIHEPLTDEKRYQTVFSREDGADGSAAAPTAGLHFTSTMLATIEAAGIGIARVTLHVGIDTFRPIRTEDLESHEMHGEWFSISRDDAGIISSARGRVVAIGTTVVRALESAADSVCNGQVAAGSGETRLFITPGHRFCVVDALLTNFHLPRSTLLAMVSAFAGRERVLGAYREAIGQGYRFYSFGDAMLLL